MGIVGNRAGVAPDLAPLQSFLAHLVTADRSARFGIPGAVLAVSGPDSREPTIVSLGTDAKGDPVGEHSLFPLNSATKLATGLLILRLIEEGKLALDAPLGDFLPEARAAATPGLTIRRLLSHTGGLTLEPPHDLSQPPGNLRYAEGLCWPNELAAACLVAEPVQPPGTSVRYSNIGYGLLGLAAERVTANPFAALLHSYVFRPLDIEASFGRLPSRAPVAIGVWDMPSPYLGTDLEPFNCRTWHSFGAPWTGLILEPAALLKLVRAYMGESILSPQMARRARSNQTHGLSGGFPTTEPFLGRTSSKSIAWTPCAWGLTVELQGGKKPHWGPSKLPASFGQVGSSGSLAWCDPQSGIAWALLGARSTDSGWLVFHGTRLAQAVFAAMGEPFAAEAD